jgi:hypothetical protein
MLIPTLGRTYLSTPARGDPTLSTLTTAVSANQLLPPGIATTEVDVAYASVTQMGGSLATLPSVQSVTSTILSTIQTLSNSSTFASVAAAASTSGFYLSLNTSGRLGITDAYYTFVSTVANLTTETYWDESLPSGAVAAPASISYPVTFHSIIDSPSWAGWSYWGTGTPALGSVSSDIRVPDVYVPPQSPAGVPSGKTVDAVSSSWVGLTGDSANGQSDLLQTGTDRDATLGNGYPVWWEDYPYIPDTAFLNTNVIPGDYLQESLNHQSGNTWSFVDVDLTRQTSWSSTVNIANYWPSGHTFTAYWTEYIEEAFTYGEGGTDVIQQIAEFSTLNFYDANYCTLNHANCWGTSNNSKNNIYQLQQNYFTDNTNQNYQSGWGGYFHEWGYPDVSWVTSSYYYYAVN